VPAFNSQLFPVNFVILHIPVDFVNPPLSSGFRDNKIPASLVPMPKTSMNKNDSFIFWQNNVRFPRKTFNMQPIPETFREQKFPDQHFRLCITAFNAAHIVTSDRRGVDISHKAKLRKWIETFSFNHAYVSPKACLRFPEKERSFFLKRTFLLPETCFSFTKNDLMFSSKRLDVFDKTT